jgi:hypothetical protein
LSNLSNTKAGRGKLRPAFSLNHGTDNPQVRFFNICSASEIKSANDSPSPLAIDFATLRVGLRADLSMYPT